MATRVELMLATMIGLVPQRAVAADAPELELAHAWSVEGPGRFDASGLAVRDGRFFVVTDRHQDTIFELHFEGAIARAVAAVKYALPQPMPDSGYLDNEGLRLAPEGGFYIASEWGFAVFHVPENGGDARWVTPNMRAVGEAAGLFATRDAYVEGVAVLPDGAFLLAAERQPRGLIEISGGNPPTRVVAQQLDASDHRSMLHGGRNLDFTDLAVWRERLFALARNQALVVELQRNSSGEWTEGDAWSYGETENAAPHRYVDMTYGTGEGLAITDEFIYVVLDNNGLVREGTSDDRRPWLFAFRNPIAAGD